MHFKKILAPLIAATLILEGGASLFANADVVSGTYIIIINGKTKDVRIGVWRGSVLHPPDDLMHANLGMFNAVPAKSNVPPNSPIDVYRKAAFDFAEELLYKSERTLKRNSKLFIVKDALAKDGTYIGIIGQKTLGFHG